MDTLKIISFKLGDEEFGLDITHVQSIERIQHITRVPNVPEYVKGVINLRGNVIPVLDLRSKLGLGETGFSESTRVIITKYSEVELGLIVEKTSNVLDIAPESIEPASSGGFNNDYFAGIAKSEGVLIILLEIAELMKTETYETDSI